MGTDEPRIKEKATEWTKFRLTPTEAYLEKEMVESMVKDNCAHDKTGCWKYLLKHWKDVRRAKNYLDLQKQAQATRAAADALLEDREVLPDRPGWSPQGSR